MDAYICVIIIVLQNFYSYYILHIFAKPQKYQTLVPTKISNLRYSEKHHQLWLPFLCDI